MGYPTEAIVESVLMIVICFLGAFGNISLFIVVFSNRQFQTISNYYVLSLASADLLVVLISGPVTAVSMLQRKWRLGNTACTLLGFVTLLTFVASVNNLATIAINRFYFIVKWREYKDIFNKRRAFLIGVCTWVYSIVLSIPPLVGWSKFGYIEDKSYCFVFWPADVYYMYFMVIMCFCGPLSIMIISYYKILSFTRELKKKLFMTKGAATKKRFFKREARMVSPEETKLTNTLLIVVACFVVCWAPFAITMFFDVYHPNPIPRWVHVSSLLLGYLNSMCNPILYGMRSTSFKKGFKNLYSKCIPCLLKTEVVSYFNSSMEGSDNDYSRSRVVKDNSQSNSLEKGLDHNSAESESKPAVIFNHKITPTLLQVREARSTNFKPISAV